MSSHSSPVLASGAYTIPDAARLLGIPASRLRAWVGGTARASGGRRYAAGAFLAEGTAADRHFNFFTLIELFTLAELRRLGVTMPTLRKNRAELRARFQTDYPFALRGLLTNGGKLLLELGESSLLELGTEGQTAFKKILEPFCQRLDFDGATLLAHRFFPMGRDHPIVVAPTHAFGRPTIAGTAIATETIASLIRGGEHPEDIAHEFEVSLEAVKDAWKFEAGEAA